MRIDEIVTLNDVLNSSQYLMLLQRLSTKVGTDINSTRLKSQIINDWKRGMKARKHYDDLLSQIDISLNDLIDK